MTDGYKFSMAEAGFPLRTETFYYTHRRGGHYGWHFLPIDAAKYVKGLLPDAHQPMKELAEDYSYLEANSYAVGAAYRKAFSMVDTVKVSSIPEGSWFYSREPAFSVTGPSAVSSWLEPTALMLNFTIQVATQAKVRALPDKMFATCEEEKELILNACLFAGSKIPEVEVRTDEYYQSILAKAKALVEAVGGNPDRIFEVGMRAVSCMAQHKIALSAIKEAGILRTSNVYLAKELGMIPVGTMGHEHIQRFGSDYHSFITMRDRFPGFISYLPDTFDSIRSGIPAALLAIQERPDRNAGIRFDSEERIKNHYFYTITECLRLGLLPQLILESGWNLEKTIRFEKYRETMEWSPDRQSYGYGGYLVEPTWKTFRRDDVAGVWKLSKSGSVATMKFGDEAESGKQSVPGLPVVYRPHPMHISPEVPVGIIGQEGEVIPNYYRLNAGNCLTNYEPNFKAAALGLNIPPQYSPATQALVDICKANRQANFNISL
jgi:nicotinic acid phosphoribosyltransferase